MEMRECSCGPILSLQRVFRLQEVLKFDGAVLDSDKKLGFMYFLIGLGMVSPPCFSAHQWMMFV